MNRAIIIIQLFALLHCVIALSFHLVEWADGWLLTILTISMVFLIAHSYQASYVAASTVAMLCCFSGFFIGHGLANYITLYIPYLFVANALSTLITTEILGIASLLILRRK